MTHHHKGNFAAKHSSKATVSDEIQQALKKKIQQQSITCAAAHAVARELNIPPAEVGMAIDLLEYRICRCQLGLFGYEPEKKIVKAAAKISPELEKSLADQSENKRLACLKAWRIADEKGMSRLECSAACEALKIKISQCQLGAF